MTWWTVAPEWAGETAFIIGGGTSVARQNLELLKGRKVIVVNSSYLAFPNADILIAHDPKWWDDPRPRPELQAFAGRIVEPCKVIRPGSQRRLHLRKINPPALSFDRDSVAMRRTTVTGAINLAVHLGAKRIVLLGADGRMGEGMRSHHHKPHPWWRFRDVRWKEHAEEFRGIVPSLKQIGVEVLNASPGSAHDMWPIVELENVV